jgi:hypothetical protein
MSEKNWNTLDLEALKKKDEEPIEIQIVEEDAPATPADTAAPAEKKEEIVEGTPEGGDKPEGEVEQEEKPKKGPTRAQRLKHQRDRERARAEQAEAFAAELARQLEEERTQKSQALKVGAEKLTKNLDSLIESAEQQLEVALTNADPKAQAAAQKRLTELVAERSRVPDVVKEAEPKAVERKPAPQGQPTYHPKAIAWAKSNSGWFGQDEHKLLTAAAYAIDADLTREGWDKGSDEYYEELETRLKDEMPKQWSKVQAGDDEEDEPRPKAKGKPAGPAAPGQGGKSAKSATLTAAEAEEARRLGVSYKDYWSQKQLLDQKSANGYAPIFVRKQ